MSQQNDSDIVKARLAVDSGKLLIRELELFPLMILINNEPVRCTIAPRVIHQLKGLIQQLEEVLAKAKA